MIGAFTVTFSGFDLTTIPDVHFSRRFPHELPERQVKTGKLARAHGGKVLSVFYGSKKILMEGYIESVDRDEMEVARDVLLYRLQPQEANLDIRQSGALRTYITTMKNVAWTHIEGGRMLFSIEFEANNPFGQDTSATALTFTNPNTAALFDTPITFGGSFNADIILAVALSSGTGLTNKIMTITNPQTGEFISVTRTWTAGDSLVIDVANKSVTVNSVEVAYNGVFPSFSPGLQTIRYTDTFTTRSVSLSGSYYKRYL